MTAPVEQSMEAEGVNRDPYTYVQREPLEATKRTVRALDIVIAAVLSAFAGILGLLLGPALAVGLLSAGVLAGWFTPDQRLRAWLVACSLLFGPLLAMLAFRGHLQAVREGNRPHRTSEPD